MARKKDGKPRMFIPPVGEPTTDDERDALGLPDAKAQMYARAAAREESERLALAIEDEIHRMPDPELKGEALTQEEYFGDDLPKEPPTLDDCNCMDYFGQHAPGCPYGEFYGLVFYRDAPEESAPEESAHRDVALAYGGLVPRKPGEFHHHFDLTSEAGLTECVVCGQGAGVPCAGPDAEVWEERMQARRDLKDRLFHLAYGMSKEGHAEAADAMAEFNAETLRLFPDRFREPTPEEQEARERFMELVSAPRTPTFQQTAAEALRAVRERQGRPFHEARPLSLVPDTLPRIEVAKPDLQQVPLTEAEEAYLAKARRQQDELNEQIRAAKEAAWDEAVTAVHSHDRSTPFPENPYRKAD